MSIELNLLPKESIGYQEKDPCGNKFGVLDSRISSQSSWWKTWAESTYWNTPYNGATNPARGCGLVNSGRGNFISEDGSIGVQGLTASNQYTLPTNWGIPQGCIGVQAWAINNNFKYYTDGSAKAKMPVWGVYVEARQYANKNSSPGQPDYAAGATFGMEIDLATYGDIATPVEPYGAPIYIDPADNFPTIDNRAFNLGLGVGGGQLKALPGDPQLSDASCCINMGSNGVEGPNQAKYKRGIIIRAGGIREPKYEAIVMASDYNICWFKPNNVMGASISGDDTGNGPQMALSFIATNASGVQQEIRFNDKDANNAFVSMSNAVTLGNTKYRWAQGFGVKGWKSQSDERAKHFISDVNELAMNAWEKVQFQQFKYNSDGNDAKWVIGVIAQRIIEAFASEGLDALDYDLVHYEDDSYSVCYEQALALECACLRRKLCQLQP